MKRKIEWRSLELDEIELVYEKAEKIIPLRHY